MLLIINIENICLLKNFLVQGYRIILRKTLFVIIIAISNITISKIEKCLCLKKKFKKKYGFFLIKDINRFLISLYKYSEYFLDITYIFYYTF